MKLEATLTMIEEGIGEILRNKGNYLPVSTLDICKDPICKKSKVMTRPW